MPNVLVLGGSGMLGSMLVGVLGAERGWRVAATVRSQELAAALRERRPRVDWRVLDAQADTPAWEVLDGCQWVINAVGITKPLIRDDNPAEVRRALQVNSVFPHLLAEQALLRGARVLQIATDCVYSGQRGGYVETDPHDALDVYGKTKSLGEAWSANVHHLRCSIIGPEPKAPKFLLEWFVRQPAGASVNGFSNHRWNGVTTLHFARICLGIIRDTPALPRLQHVGPADQLTKADLLRVLGEAYGRRDIQVVEKPAPYPVDRTLATLDEKLNAALWKAAGYPEPPRVAEMIHELHRYRYSFAAAA